MEHLRVWFTGWVGFSNQLQMGQLVTIVMGFCPGNKAIAIVKVFALERLIFLSLETVRRCLSLKSNDCFAANASGSPERSSRSWWPKTTGCLVSAFGKVGTMWLAEQANMKFSVWVIREACEACVLLIDSCRCWFLSGTRPQLPLMAKKRKNRSRGPVAMRCFHGLSDMLQSRSILQLTFWIIFVHLHMSAHRWILYDLFLNIVDHVSHRHPHLMFFVWVWSVEDKEQTLRKCGSRAKAAFC